MWPPPLVPSGYPYQKCYVGSLMRSVGSPTPRLDTLIKRAAQGASWATGSPSQSTNTNYLIQFSFQCLLISNHEIYDIGTDILFSQENCHNSTQKAHLSIKNTNGISSSRSIFLQCKNVRHFSKISMRPWIRSLWNILPKSPPVGRLSGSKCGFIRPKGHRVTIFRFKVEIDLSKRPLRDDFLAKNISFPPQKGPAGRFSSPKSGTIFRLKIKFYPPKGLLRVIVEAFYMIICDVWSFFISLYMFVRAFYMVIWNLYSFYNHKIPWSQKCQQSILLNAILCKKMRWIQICSPSWLKPLNMICFWRFSFLTLFYMFYLFIFS